MSYYVGSWTRPVKQVRWDNVDGMATRLGYDLVNLSSWNKKYEISLNCLSIELFIIPFPVSQGKSWLIGDKYILMYIYKKGMKNRKLMLCLSLMFFVCFSCFVLNVCGFVIDEKLEQ